MTPTRILPSVIILLAAALPAHAGPPEIIAHRGSSFIAPENTLASFNLAWKQDTDACELDTYLTTDHRVVVIHDATTKRTAGGKDLKVSESSSEELRKLDVGRFKGEQWAGEKIPFLEEVIATIPPGKRLFTEIKCGPEILPYLVPLIEKSGKKSQIIIIGFGLETMAAAKEKMPDVPVYWLRDTKRDPKDKKPQPHDLAWIKAVQDKKLDGIDVNYEGLTEAFAKAVHAAGLKLVTWTVDDVAEAKRDAVLGADGVTTNKPDVMKAALK